MCNKRIGGELKSKSIVSLTYQKVLFEYETVEPTSFSSDKIQVKTLYSQDRRMVATICFHHQPGVMKLDF